MLVLQHALDNPVILCGIDILLLDVKHTLEDVPHSPCTVLVFRLAYMWHVLRAAFVRSVLQRLNEDEHL